MPGDSDLPWTHRRPTVGGVRRTNESQIAVPVSKEQEALIRRAAGTDGVRITEFIVQAAVSHASDVLTDRSLFERPVGGVGGGDAVGVEGEEGAMLRQPEAERVDAHLPGPFPGAS